MEISYRRRILHGKIDILRAELVNRLRKKDESGELVISRRRRPAADRHPGRAAVPRRPTPNRRRATPWLSTAPSAASPTPRARTTASGAARSWRSPSRRPGADDGDLPVGETGEIEEVELGEVVAHAARRW